MFSTTLIRKISELEPPVRETILLMEEMERERTRWEESVTKTEFNKLKEIVRELGKSVNELAEAQKRSEERLGRLEKIVQELAEAQKRTEEDQETYARAFSNPPGAGRSGAKCSLRLGKRSLSLSSRPPQEISSSRSGRSLCAYCL